MSAIEVITGFVTAPSTTLTALTMATGNSKTIRNAPIDSPIRLLNVWSDNQTAGILRIHSSKMHDDVQGIRVHAPSSLVYPLLPWDQYQMLSPQDTLTMELSGSATAADIETACALIYYPELDGVNANLITPDELKTRFRSLMATENTLSLGTSGGYSGEEALNAELNQFKANTFYAILGYQVSAECAVVRYRSTEIGSIGLGGPGNDADKSLTGNWFVSLSYQTGLPCIPVFNSANLANVLIDGAQDENGTDVLVSTILAELSS